MLPSHSRGRDGRMYRYDISQMVLRHGSAEGLDIPHVPAGEIEEVVITQVRRLRRQPEPVVGCARRPRRQFILHA